MSRTQAIHPDPVGRPLHGQVAAELDDGCFGGVVDGRDEAVVGDHTGDAGDEDDGAGHVVADHAFGDGDGGGEDARVVDGQHFVYVLDGVVECGCDLLDPGGGDEAIYAIMLCGDAGDDTLEFFCVGYVDSVVVQAPAEVGGSALLGGEEVLARLGGAVEAVYCSEC